MMVGVVTTTVAMRAAALVLAAIVRLCRGMPSVARCFGRRGGGVGMVARAVRMGMAG